MAMKKTSQDPMEHKLKLIFKMFDIRGNGLLTKEDLARAFDAINTSYGYGMKIKSWGKADLLKGGILGSRIPDISSRKSGHFCRNVLN